MKYPLLLLLCCSSLVSACTRATEDPCATVYCDKGTCRDGACLCEEGYDGPSCSKQSSERFVGNWTVAELSGAGASIYDCQISQAGKVHSVMFGSLAGNPVAVSGQVEGLEIVVAEQPIQFGSIRGSGRIDTVSGILSMDYEIKGGASNRTTCQATFYPQ